MPSRCFEGYGSRLGLTGFPILYCDWVHSSRHKKLSANPKKQRRFGRLVSKCGFKKMIVYACIVSMMLQARTWMKPLKDACGENLKRPKFIRKPKGQLGSDQDLADTMPFESEAAEFAGSPHQPKAGDIPDPVSPPMEVLAGITKKLRETPPEGLDPRSQHKKQFKEMLKVSAGVMSFVDLCFVYVFFCVISVRLF